MTWWNFGGLNPRYRDFYEKYPDKTMIGMLWAMQWRFMLFLIALEIVVVVLLFLVGSAVSR